MGIPDGAQVSVKVALGEGSTVSTGLSVLDHLLGELARTARLQLAVEAAPGAVDQAVAGAGRGMGEGIAPLLRAPGDRLVDGARRRFHGELDTRGARELAEQVVEDAEPRRDGRAFAERDLHADLCSVRGAHGRRVALGRQVRSIEAPRARSRSSIRS